MSYREVLKNPGYRVLWIAQVISSLGSRLHTIAFIWLVYDVAGSALTLGATVSIIAIPTAVMSIPAGTIVDRVNRKWVLIMSDFVRAALVPLIPILGKDGPLLLVVIVVGVLMSIAGSFFGPARRSIIPNLVPDDQIDAANGFGQMTRVGTQSLYAIGGLIVAVLGAYSAFYVDAVTFFLSGVVLLALPSEATIPERDPEDDIDMASIRDQGRQIIIDAKDGLRYVRSHKVLPPMMGLLMVITFTNAPLGIIIPLFTLKVLEGGSLLFGLLLSSYYVGMFIGGLGVTSVLGSSLSHGQIICWGTVLSGGALALMGIVPPLVSVPVAAALLFHGLCGFFGIYAQIAGETVLQTSAPDDTRGKVLAVINGAMSLAPPISIVVVGALLDVYGPVPVVYGIGTVIAITGVLTLFTAIYSAEPGSGAPAPAD